MIQPRIGSPTLELKQDDHENEMHLHKFRGLNLKP